MTNGGPARLGENGMNSVLPLLLSDRFPRNRLLGRTSKRQATESFRSLRPGISSIVARCNAFRSVDRIPIRLGTSSSDPSRISAPQVARRLEETYPCVLSQHLLDDWDRFSRSCLASWPAAEVKLPVRAATGECRLPRMQTMRNRSLVK